MLRLSEDWVQRNIEGRSKEGKVPSSSMRMSGFLTRALAMAIRCF